MPSRPSPTARWLPLLLTLLVGRAAQADDASAPADPPELARLIDRAVAASPLAVQRRLAVVQADAEAEVAARGFRPTVALDARYTETFGNSLDLGELLEPVYQTLNQLTGQPRLPDQLDLALPLRLEAKVRLTQPLYAPAIGASRALASAGRQARRAEQAVTTRELAAAVRAAYLGHAKAAHVAAQLRAARPLLEEALRVSQLLLANAKATGEVVPAAEAELARFDLALRDVERQQASAARALNALADQALDAAIPVPPLDAAFPAMPVGGVDALVAAARRDRAEFDAVAGGRAAAAAHARLARVTTYPTVALAVDAGLQRADLGFDVDDTYAAVSLVVSWTLYDGGRSRAAARARALGELQADAQADALADQIELEVRQAWQDAEAARDAVTTADARITAAQAAYDVVAAKFAAASAPQVELVAAQTALINAQTARVVAVDDLRTHLAELRRAAGDPTLAVETTR